MNFVLPRFLRSFYRKEPLISLLITIGIVDALIGGLDDSWSLFAFGLGTAGVSLVYRWWRMQQHRPITSDDPVVQHYLPPRSSSPNLPMLSLSKKKPQS